MGDVADDRWGAQINLVGSLVDEILEAHGQSRMDAINVAVESGRADSVILLLAMKVKFGKDASF